LECRRGRDHTPDPRRGQLPGQAEPGRGRLTGATVTGAGQLN